MPTTAMTKPLTPILTSCAGGGVGVLVNIGQDGGQQTSNAISPKKTSRFNGEQSCFADLKDIEKRLDKIQEGFEQSKLSAGIKLAEEMEALTVAEAAEQAAEEQRTLYQKQHIKCSTIKETLSKHNEAAGLNAVPFMHETMRNMRRLNVIKVCDEEYGTCQLIDCFIASCMTFIKEYMKFLRVEVIVHFQNSGINLQQHQQQQQHKQEHKESDDNNRPIGWIELQQQQTAAIERSIYRAAARYAELIIESKRLRLTSRQIDRLIDRAFDVVEKVVYSKLNLRKEQQLERHELRPVLDALARKHPLSKGNYIHSATHLLEYRSPLIGKLVPDKTEACKVICYAAKDAKFAKTVLPLTLELIHQRLVKRMTDMRQPNIRSKTQFGIITELKTLAESDFQIISCMEFVP